MSATATSLYNARAEVQRENARARVIRVVPDGPKRVHLPGQYGSLGLASASDPGRLVKRAYSVSSPLLDAANGRLDEPAETPHYEFYFNRVEPPAGRETLTPKLFALQDGDRLFCGTKVTGHYTAERLPDGKDALLVATTTGEAANNAIAAAVLARGRGRVASVLLGDAAWRSLYAPEHAAAAARFPSYRPLSILADDALDRLLARLEAWGREPRRAEAELGFLLSPENAHVFLVGDPAMIGAPSKLGAWQVEGAARGAIPVLLARGFSVETRFKEGSIHYETYW